MTLPQWKQDLIATSNNCTWSCIKITLACARSLEKLGTERALQARDEELAIAIGYISRLISPKG